MAFGLSAGAVALIGGGLAAGGAIGGAAISSSAAGSAAQKQADAANHASDLQYQQYQQQRADQEPWRQAGANALSQLGNPDFQKDFSASDFQQDPGYQFRMQQGMDALQRSAAARGGLQSGGTLKALNEYGQNFASNEYQNAYNRFNNDRSQRFNRLSSIAGLGQTANSQLGQAGQNYANQVGSNMMGSANAQGAAGIAGANAWGGALSSLGRPGMDMYAMNRYAPQTSPSIPGGGSLSSLGGGGSAGELSGYNYAQSPSEFFGV